MKNKFLILTLCFTIIFSSVNFNKSYANGIDSLVVDGGVISAPMLAVVSTLALGTGLAVKNIDDIYDLGSNFYNHFKDNWSNVVDTFNKNVIITATGVVTVGSAFLELLKGFLPSQSAPVGVLGYYGDIPIYDTNSETFSSTFDFIVEGGTSVKKYIDDKNYLSFKPIVSNYYKGTLSFVGTSPGREINVSLYSPNELKIYGVRGYSNTDFYVVGTVSPFDKAINLGLLSNSTYDLVSDPDVYDDTVIDKNKDENGDLPLYVPGNLADLPGTSTNDVFVNNGTSIPYNPPVDGVVTLPGIDNPSIDVDTDITFPGVNDVPSDTPFSNITEYIIGLVVPSDTFWTDTFGGLHNNFINAFPMVDMSGFNSLIVNGKPFPNIDVKIMGSHGRIVNGDTVNSIVDWLRPIIAGFIFLCLMFFNYRKLYKLIRNSEPFEGIGKVENHAN